MRPGARSVAIGTAIAGLLGAPVLAKVCERVQFIRVVAADHRPAWVLYAAILLHFSPASRRWTPSADGLVTSVLL